MICNSCALSSNKISKLIPKASYSARLLVHLKAKLKVRVVFIPFGEMITIPAPAEFSVLESSNLRTQGHLPASYILNSTSLSSLISNEG